MADVGGLGPEEAAALRAALAAAEARAALAEARVSDDAALIAHLQPLNRQAERYAREGVPLSLSTLADQVGACAVALQPLFERLQAHVLVAERLHGDDTTVPVLANGKTDTGRCWVYVRDDRPLGGPAPGGALPLLARSPGRAPGSPPGRLVRPPPGRRLRGLQLPLGPRGPPIAGVKPRFQGHRLNAQVAR